MYDKVELRAYRLAYASARTLFVEVHTRNCLLLVREVRWVGGNCNTLEVVQLCECDAEWCVSGDDSGA